MSAVVQVPLPGGLFALVDAADAERVLAFRWQWIGSRNDLRYAQTTWALERGRGGKKKAMSMHRFILGLQVGDGLVVDHIDGDGLNNTRANLRIATRRQNCENKTRPTNKLRRQGFKGVSYSKRARKWVAYICAGDFKASGERKQIHLGCFTDPVAAAKAYDAAAIKHFGDFASLNFPAWFGPTEPPATAADFSGLQADLGGAAR